MMTENVVSIVNLLIMEIDLIYSKTDLKSKGKKNLQFIRNFGTSAKRSLYNEQVVVVNNNMYYRNP